MTPGSTRRLVVTPWPSLVLAMGAALLVGNAAVASTAGMNKRRPEGKAQPDDPPPIEQGEAQPDDEPPPIDQEEAQPDEARPVDRGEAHPDDAEPDKRKKRRRRGHSRHKHRRRSSERTEERRDPIPEPSTATSRVAAQRVPVAIADARLTWGGFIRGDIIYSTASRAGFPGGEDIADFILLPGQIPTSAADNGGDLLTLNARASRLWFKAEMPSRYGDLRALVETDFYSVNANLGNERLNNNATLRIRKAFFVVGRLKLGMDTSTFLYGPARPEKNDFGSVAARIFNRQAMISWHQPISATGAAIDVAAETPETVLVDAEGERVTPDDDHMPDLIAKLSFEGPRVKLAVAGMLRQIRAVAAVAPATSDSVLSTSLHAGARLPLFGEDNIRIMVFTGVGTGRYVSNNAYDDGTIDANGNIVLLPVVGVTGSYQHWWTDTARSNLVLSYSQAANDISRVPSGVVNRRLTTVHVNLMWNMVEKVRLGFEYLFARRERQSGLYGELGRFSATGVYNF